MTGPDLLARCPAKINLLLLVIDRRADGFHELDTVFQTIDLWDTIEIRAADRLTLDCDDPRLANDEGNLVLQAARSLRDRCGRAGLGARLTLEKKIPASAGLGGGSSDAAGALLLCNRFWGLDIPRAELAELGAGLGADVPFFFHGGTARGRGRGDRIEPLPFAGERPILLGVPPFGIRTTDVFRAASERLTLPRNGVSVPLFSALKWPKDNDFWFLANDLETVVFEDWPELREFRDALGAAGARGAALSGSGSTVYGVFPGEKELGAASRELRRAFPRWRILATRAIESAAHLRGPKEGSGETIRRG